MNNVFKKVKIIKQQQESLVASENKIRSIITELVAELNSIFMTEWKKRFLKIKNLFPYDNGEYSICRKPVDKLFFECGSQSNNWKVDYVGVRFSLCKERIYYSKRGWYKKVYEDVNAIDVKVDITVSNKEIKEFFEKMTSLTGFKFKISDF